MNKWTLDGVLGRIRHAPHGVVPWSGLLLLVMFLPAVRLGAETVEQCLARADAAHEQRVNEIMATYNDAVNAASRKKADRDADAAKAYGNALTTSSLMQLNGDPGWIDFLAAANAQLQAALERSQYNYDFAIWQAETARDHDLSLAWRDWQMERARCHSLPAGEFIKGWKIPKPKPPPIPPPGVNPPPPPPPPQGPPVKFGEYPIPLNRPIMPPGIEPKLPKIEPRPPSDSDGNSGEGKEEGEVLAPIA